MILKALKRVARNKTWKWLVGHLHILRLLILLAMITQHSERRGLKRWRNKLSYIKREEMLECCNQLGNRFYLPGIHFNSQSISLVKYKHHMWQAWTYHLIQLLHLGITFISIQHIHHRVDWLIWVQNHIWLYSIVQFSQHIKIQQDGECQDLYYRMLIVTQKPLILEDFHLLLIALLCIRYMVVMLHIFHNLVLYLPLELIWT